MRLPHFARHANRERVGGKRVAGKMQLLCALCVFRRVVFGFSLFCPGKAMRSEIKGSDLPLWLFFCFVIATCHCKRIRFECESWGANQFIPAAVSHNNHPTVIITTRGGMKGFAQRTSRTGYFYCEYCLLGFMLAVSIVSY